MSEAIKEFQETKSTVTEDLCVAGIGLLCLYGIYWSFTKLPDFVTDYLNSAESSIIHSVLGVN